MKLGHIREMVVKVGHSDRWSLNTGIINIKTMWGEIKVKVNIMQVNAQ